MADVFTPEERSRIMAKIRSEDTGPEVRLRQLIRNALGYRWRIDNNVAELPGTPDVVVPALKLAIFADGCFYHGCPLHHRVPKTNVVYWSEKVALNKRRDRRNDRKLRSLGFSVWHVWEHDLKPTELPRTEARLRRRLAVRMATLG